MTTKSKGKHSSHAPTPDNIIADAIVQGRAEGKTYQQIANTLKVSHDVLYRVMHTIPFERYLYGLVSKQLDDIVAEEAGDNREQAMHFRDRLIGKIMPRTFKGTITHQSGRDVDAEVLEKYGPLLRAIQAAKPPEP